MTSGDTSSALGSTLITPESSPLGKLPNATPASAPSTPPELTPTEKAKASALAAFKELQTEAGKNLGCWLWEVLCDVCSAIAKCAKVCLLMTDEDCLDEKPLISLTASNVCKDLTVKLNNLRVQHNVLSQKINKFKSKSAPEDLGRWDDLRKSIDLLECEYKKQSTTYKNFQNNWEEDIGKQFEACKKELGVPATAELATKKMAILTKQYKEFDKKLLPNLITTFTALQGVNPDEMRKLLETKLNKTAAIEKCMQYQAKTIALLENATDQTKDKVLHAYRAYLKLFRSVRDVLLTDNIPAIENNAKIRQLASELVGTTDELGFTNFNSLTHFVPNPDKPDTPLKVGNTCWMNTAIQMIRMTPGTMEKLRAPLHKRVEADAVFQARKALVAQTIQLATESSEEFEQRQTKNQAAADKLKPFGESDQQFANRVKLRDALLEVIDALPFGTTTLNEALCYFWHTLYTAAPGLGEDFPMAHDLYTAPGAQKDPANFFEAFLRIIEMELKITNHKTRNGIVEEAGEPAPLILPFLDVRGADLKPLPFIKSFENAWSQNATVGLDHSEHLHEEWCLKAAPKALFTCLKRFSFNNTPEIPQEEFDLIHGQVSSFLTTKFKHYNWTSAQIKPLVDAFSKGLAEIVPKPSAEEQSQFQVDVTDFVMNLSAQPKMKKIDAPIQSLVKQVFGSPLPPKHGDKISDPVPFPAPNDKGEIIIDLTDTVPFKDLKANNPGKSYKYRLISIGTHQGTTLAGGHWTAYGYGQDGKLRHYNDSVVTSVDALDPANSYAQSWELIEEVALSPTVAPTAVPPKKKGKKANPTAKAAGKPAPSKPPTSSTPMPSTSTPNPPPPAEA